MKDLRRPESLVIVLALVVTTGLIASTMPTSADLVRAVPQQGAGGGGGGGTTLPVDDGTAIVKGSADATKLLRFEVDTDVATGTTRVLTIPSSDATIALSQGSPGGIQLFGRFGIGTNSGAYFGGNSEATASFAINVRAENTPDSGQLLVNQAISRALLLTEMADEVVDFAHASPAHPTLFVQSSDGTVITQYNGVSATGLRGELFKTLTESAATSFVQIPVAAGAFAAGQVVYTIFASDGTDHQTRTGSVYFGAVNKAATETCGAPTEVGTSLANVSLGTLTVTWTCDTTPANAVNLQANAVSSLTQTTLRIYYKVISSGAGEPLPQ